MSFGSQEDKKRPRQSRAHHTPLALAFDQCPSVLFSLFSDVDACNVATALCIPKFLATKLYEIKRHVGVMAVLAGRYPCVVRNVVFGGLYDDARMVAKLPSTVTSMRIDDHPSMDLTISDLPRSLTRLSFEQDGDFVSDFLARARSPEEWPPLLAELDIHCEDLGAEVSMPHLPPALRHLDAFCDLHYDHLPNSLVFLRINELRMPLSQLPPNLASLEIEHLLAEDVDELKHLPPSLTYLSVAGYSMLDCTPTEVEFPESLRVLHIHFLANWLPHLPRGLTDLLVQDSVDEPSWHFTHPLRHASLTSLRLLGGQFYQLIRAVDLPSLQTLKLENFSLPLDDLPLSLTSLFLLESDQKSMSRYSHPLDQLPPGLTRLQLHRDYEHALDHLPASLRYLDIKGSFNRPLDHLPYSLLQLWLKCPAFNHPLDHLPPSLTDLLVAGGYNQPLNHLPASLTKLSLYSPAFTHPLDRLPQGLHTLRLGFDFAEAMYAEEFKGIEPPELEFKVPLDHLPDALQQLYMPNVYAQPLDHLPSRLQGLTFPYHSTFNRPLNHLPDSLSKLRLNGDFNQPFLRLPRGLTDLCFADSRMFYNHPLPLVRPSADSTTNKSHKQGPGEVEVTYPTALRSLRLAAFFDQPLSLPPSLEFLGIPPKGEFNQPLPLSSLPVNLTYLGLPRFFIFSHPEFADVAAVRQRCPYVAMPREPMYGDSDDEAGSYGGFDDDGDQSAEEEDDDEEEEDEDEKAEEDDEDEEDEEDEEQRR